MVFARGITKMSESKCECSMAIAVLGDGCRYCQPQEYIDRLEDWLDEQGAILEKLEDNAIGPEWISMQDQSPPIIGKCLGWNARANKILGPATYRIFVTCAENTSDISHWMLLPEPPKQDSLN
jgi:hypothetical protein